MWSSCIRTEEWKCKRQFFYKGEKIPITYKRQNEGYAEETRHQLAASGTLIEHCKVWADKTLASCESAVAKRGKASVLRSCNVSVEVLPASMRLFIHPNFPYTLLKNTNKRVHPIKITLWCPHLGKILFLSHCIKGTYYPHGLSLLMLTLNSICQFLYYKVFPF